ncbi:MAG TPA: ATP-binding protein [Bacteroidetes bacterium]|nr:ATP-binding protein [Bacteroidota bacterium]
MLLKFKVENFLSFGESQEFSMLSGQSTKLKQHTRKIGKTNQSALKTAVIYGANASGKSNFISAVDMAKRLVVKGTENTVAFQKHFRLAPEKENEISSFEFEIKIEDEVYAYGFDIILKTKEVKEEWLFRVGTTKDFPIFERTTDKNGNVNVDLSIKFKRKENRLRVHYIGEDTKPTQLFLTELSKRNIRKIKEVLPIVKVFDWIEDDLVVIYPHSKYTGIELIGNDETLSDGFCEFLKLFDTGISGIETKAEKVENIFKGMPEEIKNDIVQNFDDMENKERRGVVFGDDFFSIYKDIDGEIKFSKLMTKHISKKGNDILFDLGDESDGTQRMFDLIPALIMLAVSDKTFLIDELDRSLHPLLSKKIIELFLKNSINNNSQLIVTTHESSLLDLKLLRRDEVWFVKKNEHGESILYSLEEYKPRHDKEIRKGYLHGRFEGIPEIGSVEELTWLPNLN